MAVTTVAQLAAELNRPATALLAQLRSAGVAKQSADDALTDADKAKLLEHLRVSHGSAPGAERKKISITRKTRKKGSPWAPLPLPAFSAERTARS